MFRKRFSRIGQLGKLGRIGRIGKIPGKDSAPGARSCVSPALALAEPSASISCRFLQILLVHVVVDYRIDLRTFQFSPVKHCLSLSPDSEHAKVLNPRCLTEFFTQNLMDLEYPGTVPAFLTTFRQPLTRGGAQGVDW